MIEKCVKCGKQFDDPESPFDVFFGGPLKDDNPLCPRCIRIKLDESLPEIKLVTREASLVREFNLDCETLEDVAPRENVKIVCKDDFYGDGVYELVLANGEKRWAVESGGQYASDAFFSNIKLYRSPVIVAGFCPVDERWWNGEQKMIKKGDKIYALYGWNGQSYTDSWQVIGGMEAVGKYDIRPVYYQYADDDIEIINYEICEK